MNIWCVLWLHACIHTHPDPINILDGEIYMDSNKCTHPFHCSPSVFASHVSFYSLLECVFYNLSERLAGPFPLFNRNGEIFFSFMLLLLLLFAEDVFVAVYQRSMAYFNRFPCYPILFHCFDTLSMYQSASKEKVKQTRDVAKISNAQCSGVKYNNKDSS